MRISTQVVAKRQRDLSTSQWRIVAEKTEPTFMWHWFLDPKDIPIVMASRDRGTISMVHRYDRDRTVLLCKLVPLK
jgi:hypothetical protein